MSWWSDAVSAVGNAVESAVTVVTDAVSDVVETVGNAINDGLDALADAASNLPVVGGVIGGILRWVGGVVAGACDLVAAGIKAVGSIVGGLLGGTIKIVGGLLGLDLGLVIEGFVDIASGIAGAIVVVGGEFIAVFQTTFFLQNKERILTKAEQELLRRIYLDSLALYNIRIVENRYGIFGINNRSFTLGNTIYLKSNDPHTLVHESLHVWQYQHHGSRYAGDAIGAQWFIQDHYNWQSDIANGNVDWVDFNAEAQAQFVEDIFIFGTLTTGGILTTGDGVFYDAQPPVSTGAFTFNGTDHTNRANDAVAVIRGAINSRLSNMLG